MPADRLSVAVVAELREFERRMALLPDIGQKQARELSAQIGKELKNAEKSVGDSSKAMGSALGKVTEVVKKGFEAAGGPVASVGKLLFDFAAPLGQAASQTGSVVAGFGTMGTVAVGASAAVLGVVAAVAAVAVGTGLAVAGAVALTNAAIGAADRLEAMGQAALVPDGAREALDQYQGSTARLWQQLDVLTVQLGAALAPALTALADVLGDVIEWVNSLDKSFDALRRGIDQAVAMLPQWARWEPAIKLVRGAVDALEQSYDELVETAGEAKLAPTQEEIDRWAKLAEERRKIASDEAARQRKELTDAIAAEVAYTDEIAALQQWLADNQLLLDDLVWQQKLTGYQEQIAAHQAAENAMLQATIEAGKARADVIDDEVEDRRKATEVVLQSIDQIVAATEDLTTMIVESYKRRAEAGEDLSLREQQAANRAFRAAQAAAIAQVGLQMAVSFAGFLAFYSPTGPFAFLAASAQIAAAAAAIAPILGQEPPFPQATARQLERDQASGPSPRATDPVDERGTRAGYADAYGSGNISASRTSGSTSGSGSEVAITVLFSDGRLGKRRII